jgi:hypothetical protein
MKKLSDFVLDCVKGILIAICGIGLAFSPIWVPYLIHIIS